MNQLNCFVSQHTCFIKQESGNNWHIVLYMRTKCTCTNIIYYLLTNETCDIYRQEIPYQYTRVQKQITCFSINYYW